MSPVLIPESVQDFLHNTGLSIDQVAKISGIDKNHLVWAAEGKVSLDIYGTRMLMVADTGLRLRTYQMSGNGPTWT